MTISLRTGVYLPAFKAAPQRAPGTPATAHETLRKLTDAAASPETKAALTKLGEQVEAARTLATSMKTARDEARSAVKQQAHATVQRLKEEYKLIRKLWAHNPAEMARQLGRVAKELKRAVTSYTEAARANIERVADLGPETDVKAEASADSGQTPDEKQSDKSEQHSSDSENTLPARLALSPRAELADALKAYARQAPADVFAMTAEERRQEFESAEMEAGGDLEFSKEVKGFIKALREELQLARIRAGLIKDRATEDAFKETQKTLTELDKDIADMEGDIIDAFPKLAQTRTV